MSSDAIIILSIIAGILLIGLLYKLYQAFTEFLGYAKKIAIVCGFLYKNRKPISGLVASIEDIYKGANKINQDAVDANLALIKEVVRLRESVDRFVTYMIPAEPAAAQLTPEMVEYRYKDTYQELVKQGVDPDIAKYKAANIELELMADQGLGDQFSGIGA
jgi:hypothetical protein